MVICIPEINVSNLSMKIKCIQSGYIYKVVYIHIYHFIYIYMMNLYIWWIYICINVYNKDIYNAHR